MRALVSDVYTRVSVPPLLSNVNRSVRRSARRRRGRPQELVDRPRPAQLGNPDNLADVQRVVMSDVKKDVANRLFFLARYLGEPIRRKCAKGRTHSPGDVLPDLEHIALRAPAARGKLGIAIANEGHPTDDVLDEMSIRSRDVQDQISDGVRLIVRPPPQVIL